jgi:hypothetical protein
MHVYYTVALPIKYPDFKHLSPVSGRLKRRPLVLILKLEFDQKNGDVFLMN